MSAEEKKPGERINENPNNAPPQKQYFRSSERRSPSSAVIYILLLRPLIFISDHVTTSSPKIVAFLFLPFILPFFLPFSFSLPREERQRQRKTDTACSAADNLHFIHWTGSIPPQLVPPNPYSIKAPRTAALGTIINPKLSSSYLFFFSKPDSVAPDSKITQPSHSFIFFFYSERMIP